MLLTAVAITLVVALLAVIARSVASEDRRREGMSDLERLEEDEQARSDSRSW